VKIEHREGVSADDARSAGQELTRQIKIHVGSTCRTDVVEPGSLARSNGKMRRIYDLRNKELGDLYVRR
jgi:phenylacetate-CoA ligase